MAETRKRKPWRVGEWKNGGYEITYYKDGVPQCTFVGRMDDRKGCFYLRLVDRYPYGEVPKTRVIYISETERA